jgi:hypothetical protein
LVLRKRRFDLGITRHQNKTKRSDLFPIGIPT